MVEWRGRTETNPYVMLEKPVLKGAQIPGEHILPKVAANIRMEDVACEYLGLRTQDIQAVLASGTTYSVILAGFVVGTGSSGHPTACC